MLGLPDMSTGRIFFNSSVVRGLEYYTGPVYEAELTFTVTGDDGRPVRFGSVGGGGRYDGLIGRFRRSEPVPATGFSIGVSRLLAALQAVKSPLVTGADVPGPVVVLVMDRERIADYQRMVARLRHPDDGSQPIRAELYLGGAGMKAQMKYADRRRSVRRHPGLRRARPRRGADQGSGARRRARRRPRPRRLPGQAGGSADVGARRRMLSCRRCARSWRAVQA